MRNVFTDSSRYRADRYLLAAQICRAVSRQWIGHCVSLSEWREEWFYEGLHTHLQEHCITEVGI